MLRVEPAVARSSAAATAPAVMALPDVPGEAEIP